METAAVSQFKVGLSRYLARVKAGEEIVVTERGKAIARVVPFADIDPQSAELAEMIRAGLIRPPKAEHELGSDFWDAPRWQDPDDLMLRTLLDERDHGR